MTKFPKPLPGTYKLLRADPPLFHCIDTLSLTHTGLWHSLLTPADRFSCSSDEPGYSSCRLYTGYRYILKKKTGEIMYLSRLTVRTIGSQYQQSWLRCLIERFTFVQLLYPFLTDVPLRVFCLLTLAVQYLSLERKAPQGGLETLPVKRIRETNHL